MKSEAIKKTPRKMRTLTGAKEKTFVYWTKKATSNPEKLKEIRGSLNLTPAISVNGETEIVLTKENRGLIEQMKSEGYIQLRVKQ